MRKIIERIELNEEEVIKYSKCVYEYNAAQDMFIASAKKGLDLDANINVQLMIIETKLKFIRKFNYAQARYIVQ